MCWNCWTLICRTQIAEFSPQRNLEQIKEKLPPGFSCLVSVGEYESAEFKRQGEEFHKVCCIGLGK